MTNTGIPPHNLEAERAVLGAILLEPKVIGKIELKPDDFYRPAHQKIFEVMRKLYLGREVIDLLTITDMATKDNCLDMIGGASYLSEIANEIPTSANIIGHSGIIKDKMSRRTLLKAATTVIGSIDDEDIETLRTIIRGSIKTTRGNTKIIMARDLSKSTAEGIEETIRRAKNKEVIGIPSGFIDIDRITHGWQPENLIIIGARPGMGKCLGRGTKVLMFDGMLKKVEDIIQGELLMGVDSQPRTVLSTTRNFGDMYWIRQNKGINYRVNKDHILSLKRSRTENGFKNGDVLNISVEDYLSKSPKFRNNYKGYKHPVDFPSKQLSIPPYLLGLWLGNGKSTNPVIYIRDGDSAVKKYIHHYTLNTDLKIHEYQQSGCAALYISKKVCNSHKKSKLAKDMEDYNLFGNKHIPEDFLINSTDNRLELLAGLLDTDGHYLKESNGYEITQKSKTLSQQIKFLCDSLGFKTSIARKKATIKKINYQCDVYCVLIFGDIDKIPTKTNRNKPHERRGLINWRVTGIQVEYDKQDEYFGFELDGDGLFLLEDMTVTHNSALMGSSSVISAKKGNPVGWFALEMGEHQTGVRHVSDLGEIPLEHLQKGVLKEEEYSRYVKALGTFADLPIYYCFEGGLTIEKIAMHVETMVEEHGVKMVIIDYLQLMRPSEGKDREAQVSHISREAKALAKKHKIPIIALAQLNRSCESRTNKRPLLSDLRESGALEQDADVVMFLYRHHYYNKSADPAEAECRFAKNRNGRVGTVKLLWQPEYTRFRNLAPNQGGY